MYEAYTSTCHGRTLKDEFENNKENTVFEKEGLIKKKEMGNKEILREKKKHKISSQQYESELWNADEVNNELKSNGDEQQDDKKKT